MMKLNSSDINRLIRACEMYKDQAGSEYMWNEYEHLVNKLRYYQEENCVEEQIVKRYIVTVDGIKHVVYSTASEWFVLTSTLSHIQDKKTWSIYWDGHC